MPDFSKIAYYDLKLEQQNQKLPAFFGRENDIRRLSRTLTRVNQNNALIVGPSGLGKSAFVRGWAAEAAKLQAFANLPIVELSSASLLAISTHRAYRDAFASITKGIVIIDGFGQLIGYQTTALQTWISLLQPLLDNPNVHIVMTIETKEFEWLSSQGQSFIRNFEVLRLDPQPQQEIKSILSAAAKKMGQARGVTVSEKIIADIIKFCGQFPSLGILPGSGISLLDECIAEACAKTPVGGQTHEITADTLTHIISDKANVPLPDLNTDDREKLKTLLANLERSIVGQTPALTTITSVIQRAKLGLKNSSRPLGSFLMLGPSGVGKTETAKVLAGHIFGKTSAFLRIDMSEFGESHTVARLIGSPPGYLGSDSGGQLTNHLKANPHSLILLDEIEKAHPKIFDIFLQILDDGRLTSGRGETVDAAQSIIIATSNLGVDHIIDNYQQADVTSSTFMQETLMPLLRQNFRTEFLNRFDSITVYQPLTPDALIDIALLEIKKIEERVKDHNIRFSITREALMAKVTELADPRLGARPVKRFIEELCEGLITKKLLG